MKIYVKKEDKNYYLDAHCTDTLQGNSDVYMGTIVLDFNHGTYYLLPTENEKYDGFEENKMSLGQYFVNEAEEKLISSLSTRLFKGNMTGDLKSYAEEILLRNIAEYQDKVATMGKKKAKILEPNEVAYIITK